MDVCCSGGRPLTFLRRTSRAWMRETSGELAQIAEPPLGTQCQCRNRHNPPYSARLSPPIMVGQALPSKKQSIRFILALFLISISYWLISRHRTTAVHVYTLPVAVDYIVFDKQYTCMQTVKTLVLIAFLDGSINGQCQISYTLFR